MKKINLYIFGIIFLFLIISLLANLDLTSFDFASITSATTFNSIVKDEGNISVHFCPQEDCEQILINYLNSVEKSLHCALFDVGLKSVQQLLLDKEKQIEVKVVTDNDYLKKFNHSFVKADSYGLMHNKFCIIDGKKIFAGSMNPTDNCAHKNNNNLLLIESKVLADNYEDEFQELWSGVFKKGDPVANSGVQLGQTIIYNYFCPDDSCADRIKEELKQAKESIYFMTFSFTHEGIANIILLKKEDGLAIQGVMETRQISDYSKFQLLQYQNISVLKDGNKNNLHHKVFIIDGETVITGSMNPTAGGDEKNDENLLIIKDKTIAEKFMKEFWKVWGEAEAADNLK
ncbi:MAG TPA: phospholipase D-like domain-containing protein [Candidatus Nanoarchaeia archaeon]|nr:phospholipase D-like domain-containing protein [Candidatus Nanoarchaeia archaeon]